MVLKHTKFKEPFYIETQEEYKAQKIDGVICKLEGVLVSTNRLMKNAYYYTAEKYLNKQLYDDELEELIKKDYKEYFAENSDAIKYFEEYFNKNLNQITVLQNSRLFFETLFVHDYHVAVITKYSKEFADFVLKTLKITQFVSIIIDEGIADGNHIEKAIKSINKARNILVIADKKEEFIEAKKHGVKTCLFTNSEDFDEIKNTTYVINKMIDMENIIIE
jgi:phosphoglycolate phosphatase-like HAD superfamily hydrolase